MQLRSALLAASCACALGLVVVAPAHADAPVCGDSTGDQVASGAVLDQLQIRSAHEVVRAEAPAGERPVGVAVLDSGVAGGPIPVTDQVTIAGGGEVRYFHGTAVAGLIAGPSDDGEPIGIAPDARIIDVRVYDGDGSDPDDETVEADTIAAGLEWVTRNADDLNIRVANVSLIAGSSDRLRRAVRAARDANIVVVAAAGNRPTEGEPFDADFADGEPGKGEDAARTLFPTGYDDVLSVSATATGSDEPDASAYVLENSNIAVAAPTFGVTTYGLDGRPCVLQQIGTSWAAAEVSGVLALLAQRYPDDTDEQLVSRVVNTANGTTDHPTPLTGAGVVQPVEALTRPLDPATSGRVEHSETLPDEAPRAVAPDPQDDPLAATREDAVWWGLIGGGILIVALLLRPVLARRRT